MSIQPGLARDVTCAALPVQRCEGDGISHMAPWVRVAALDDCPPGAAGEWVVAGQVVAWFNVDGEICALDGICPHQGGPLGRGRLDGSVVTCPWHGWQFDVRTGRYQVNPTLHHPRHRVKVERSDIFVQLDDSRSPADD